MSRILLGLYLPQLPFLLQHLHLNQHQYLLPLQHQPPNITNGNMKAMVLLMTITASAFGIRSMANGNGILRLHFRRNWEALPWWVPMSLACLTSLVPELGGAATCAW